MHYCRAIPLFRKRKTNNSRVVDSCPLQAARHVAISRFCVRKRELKRRQRVAAVNELSSRINPRIYDARERERASIPLVGLASNRRHRRLGGRIFHNDRRVMNDRTTSVFLLSEPSVFRRRVHLRSASSFGKASRGRLSSPEVS